MRVPHEICNEDVETNRMIGVHGHDIIKAHSQAKERRDG